MINETIQYKFSRLSLALLRIINKIEKPFVYSQLGLKKGENS